MTGSDRGRFIAALAEVLQERSRQVLAEGYEPAHDLRHTGEELARAAAVYATPNGARLRCDDMAAPMGWPEGWAPPRLPKPRRRELVIAAALLLAELERLDTADDDPQDGER